MPGAAAALEGRLGGGAASVPKKSRPSRESAGLVCLAGAGSAFRDGLESGGEVVCDLLAADALSDTSANRSG
jgi:hypothetical protein